MPGGPGGPGGRGGRGGRGAGGAGGAGGGPAGPPQLFHPVGWELLPGHPREGGFGVLAMPEHIRAREAVLLVWVVREGCKGEGGSWGELARLQWQPRGRAGGLHGCAWMGMFFAQGRRPDGDEM